ncbi:hypothetical protein SFRURICE_001390, partial [Spodoptera frugiperda]
ACEGSLGARRSYRSAARLQRGSAAVPARRRAIPIIEQTFKKLEGRTHSIDLIFPLWKRLSFKRLILTKNGFRNHDDFLCVVGAFTNIQVHSHMTPRSEKQFMERIKSCPVRESNTLFDARQLVVHLSRQPFSHVYYIEDFLRLKVWNRTAICRVGYHERSVLNIQRIIHSNQYLYSRTRAQQQYL